MKCHDFSWCQWKRKSYIRLQYNTKPFAKRTVSPFVRTVDVPNVRQIYIMTGYDLSQRERIWREKKAMANKSNI